MCLSLDFHYREFPAHHTFAERWPLNSMTGHSLTIPCDRCCTTFSFKDPAHTAVYMHSLHHARSILGPGTFCRYHAIDDAAQLHTRCVNIFQISCYLGGGIVKKHILEQHSDTMLASRRLTPKVVAGTMLPYYTRNESIYGNTRTTNETRISALIRVTCI